MVDISGPTELVKKSTLTLNFSDRPVYITVYIREDNKTLKQTVTDNKVVMSELKGSVIYIGIATWKQGTVWYAFLVNMD